MASSSKTKAKKGGKLSKSDQAKKKIVSFSEDFRWLKMLAYGKNGVGKTRLAASGPNALLIDCNEKGTLTVRGFPGRVYHLDKWDDIDLIYWHLKAGKHDFETVGIDTVTSLAQLCMRKVLGEESALDPTQDPNMPSKREWGKVGELMRTEILKFRNLPMHVLFLAQERRGFSEEDEEAPEIFPEVSPSVRTTLTAAVDVIGRMFVKEVVTKEKGVKGKKQKKTTAASYRMLVGPSERYTTKDRSGVLPRVVTFGPGKDNLTRLIETIRAGEAEEE